MDPPGSLYGFQWVDDGGGFFVDDIGTSDEIYIVANPTDTHPFTVRIIGADDVFVEETFTVTAVEP
jgi:hypothetical protein